MTLQPPRRAVGPLLLAALAGCVRSTPLPDLGPCADYPDGVYEYGEVGIGTCLAGPVDLAFLGDGHTLAVSNGNPYGDYTGGSALLLDLDRLDLSTGRNLSMDLASGALAMPSFNADLAWLPESDTLAVTNRLSEDGRTREQDDALYFIDVADPTAPAFDTTMAADGALLVGFDPNTVERDPTTGLLFVVNRTAHELAMIDATEAPAEKVPPGGPARLLEAPFEDRDGSGSRASFSILETQDAGVLDGHQWSMHWNVASIRTWQATAAGLVRYEGNGETTWEAAANGVDVALADTDLISEAIDPSFGWGYDEYGAAAARLVFMDQGLVRDAQAYDMADWEVGSTALLSPDDELGESVIGGPALLAQDGTWYLFYDGGNGTKQDIHLALSADGTTFERAAVPLIAPEGSSYEDPFLYADGSADVWRMYFTVVQGNTTSIGEAWSDDLLTWTELPQRYAPTGGAAAPSVAYYGGRFHLYYTSPANGPWAMEAQSLDGTHWGTPRRAFPVDPVYTARRSRLAIDAVPEDNFGVVDESGQQLPEVLTPGDYLVNTDNGWMAAVTAGQWVDPTDVGALADAGVSIDSALPRSDGSTDLWLSWTDADGVGRIGYASETAGDVVVDSQPLLEPGAAGGFDDDSVGSPVVIDTGDGYVMYYLGLTDGLGSIGRATSPDGLTWTADPDPVLVPELDFEAERVQPGSAVLGDDGTVHLYYTGYDGSRFRIGEATAPVTGGAFTRLSGVDTPFTLDSGSPGEWNDSGVASPSVLVEGDTERMWFAGYSGQAWSLGYAERTGGGEWALAADPDGNSRPLLGATRGSFGSLGLVRPVAMPGAQGRDDGYTIWYTGLDATSSEDPTLRAGRAVTQAPDRLWRDLKLPTLADAWGFTVVPESDETAIPLDVTVDGSAVFGLGCTGLASDPLRGFLYVTCKDTPYVYVVDVRDDSSGDFQDLNYLAVETVVPYATSRGAYSGARSGVLDPTRPWLWALGRKPEALIAIDLSKVADDGDLESTPGSLAAMIPLPRAGRDAGEDTQSDLGSGYMALHPDGRHLFVTNFNANSVYCFDLASGAPATLVGQAADVGEGPYAVAISPDGKYAVVGNYLGEIDDDATSSTLTVIDADPTSPTFLQPLTWITNR